MSFRAERQRLEHGLGASDPAVRMVLIGVIAAAVLLLIQPSRALRLAGALWLVLP